MIRNWYKKGQKNNNAGFTFVELVVVLALMAILLSITIFGGLAWQDWSRFQHEDSVAEEIFFAAQNQLVELDSSGATERSVIRPLKSGGSYIDDYILAYYRDEDTESKVGRLESIMDANGESITWNNVWEKGELSSSLLGLKNVNQLDEKSILKIRAGAGEYDTYLTYKGASASVRESMLGSEISEGTILLFDLIAPYISDKSVLGGAICLEFSPETGQVFSALYSDQANNLYYNYESSYAGGGDVNVCDRRLQVRERLMLGYYGVDKLTEKIRGKGADNSKLRLEIRNNELLTLVLQENENGVLTDDVKLNFVIYNGNSGGTGDEAMLFTIDYEDIPKTNTFEDAQDLPISVPVTLKKGIYATSTKAFRFPVWVEDGKIFIVLDAADVQAQTSIYASARSPEDADTDYAAQFRNTYSFYRFGMANEVNYIYASVTAVKSTQTDDETEEGVVEYTAAYSQRQGIDSSGTSDHVEIYNNLKKEGVEGFLPCGECVAFASYSQDSTTTENINSRTFEISNARHFYNMRYETEFKTSVSPRNTFRLTSDIDWNVFVGRSSSGTESEESESEQTESATNAPRNYFFTSFNEGIHSGIDYSGYSKVTGGSGTFRAIDQTNNNTQNYPFPAFRCLGVGDEFTQEKPYGDSEGGSYTISNLTISFAANVVYGVYDDSLADDVKLMSGSTVLYDAQDHMTGEGEGTLSVKDLCLRGDFSGLLGLNETRDNSSGSNLARGGALPLGLFCENLGTITNITLDKHIVRGIEPVVSPENATPEQLVCTNMVGGFAGNNAGYIANLTLLNTADPNGSDNITVINGRTDVGGIIGRESFVVPDHDAANRIAEMIAPEEEETGESSASSEMVDSKDITISGMKNYGSVTGMENIGGIVGRVYTHYVGENNRVHNYNSFTQFSSGSAVSGSDETTLRRYKYYHDGYFITDSGKSMTNIAVERVDQIVLSDCSNRGVVSGDELFYNVQNHSGYNQIDTRCAFIGGIAGITMDGFIFDDPELNAGTVSSKSTSNAPIRAYALEGFFDPNGFSYVTVKNCDSFVESDSDTFATGVTYDNQLALMDGIHSLSRDYYVGGLVGYARLTSFENCNNKLAEAMNDDGSSNSYVIGAAYVGGITGCSDYSKYNQGERVADDLSSGDGVSGRTYYAINYNNVIGRAYVGGIAGAFGIGCTEQEKMNFRNPSENQKEGELSPSCAYGESSDHMVLSGRNLLNKGATLVLNNKNYAWFETAECRYDRMSPTGSTGMVEVTGGCGGIAGAASTALADCDNIQTEGTKDLVAYLVSGESDADFYSMDTSLESILTMREQSLYGGNAVGGLIGVNFEGGVLNPNTNASNSKSLIDAVVYGRDRIGGAIGVNQVSDCCNFYPTLGTTDSQGMLVVGEDMVGGLYGDLRVYTFNADTISSKYMLRGRYAVGGLIGEINTDTRQNRTGNDWKVIRDIQVDLPDNANSKVVVDGIACVGGCIGLSDNHDVYCEGNGDSAYLMKGIALSDMDVHGKYFAGGIYGALLHGTLNVTASSAQNKLNETANRQVCGIRLDETVSVNADAFAGGMVGFYNYFADYNRLQGDYGETETSGSVHAILQGLKDENGSYGDYRDAYSDIVETDNTNGAFINTRTNEITVSFSDYASNEVAGERNLSVSDTVEANIFAGGLVGFMPNGLNVRISGFVNGANIRTTGYVGGDSETTVSESYDSSVKYSYLGSVIGRVPSGMTLENCVNTVSGIFPANAATAPQGGYYYATSATYLGGLTEVNAGMITGTTKANGPDEGDNYTVKTSYINYLKNVDAYDYSAAESIIGVGAFAGVNGTKNTNGTTTGVIAFCSNQAPIKAKNAAGITAVVGGPSEVKYCENRGTISSSDTTNGIVSGITVGAMGGISRNTTTDNNIALVNNIKITSCVNLAEINPADTNGRKTSHSAGIVYNTNSCGNIVLCRNYGGGVNYGISAFEAATVSKNLEASGLNEQEGTKKPIAPMASSSLEKNFYISAVGDDDDEDDDDDTPKGWITPKITKENTGNVHFIVKVNGTEKNELYDRNEKSGSTQLFYMQRSNNQEELTLEYDVVSDEHEGVFMKYFNIVWGGQGWSVGSEFVYDITFDYIDSAGVNQSVTYRRRIMDDPIYTVTDIVPTPGDDVRITKITIHSSIHFDEYNNTAAVNWQYDYAYWTDAFPVHYISKTDENLEESEDDIYFYSRRMHLDRVPSEFTALYNSSSTGDILSPLYLGVGAGNDEAIRDINIWVKSPSMGIPADKIRIYYNNNSNALFHKQNDELEYRVIFSYIDSEGDAKTIEMDRDIHVSGRTGSYDYYDEIPIRTGENYCVYTNNIEVIWDNRNGSVGGNLGLRAIVWVDEDGNEWPIADKNHKYTLSDTDRATTLNVDSIKAVNTATSQTVKTNHWPIRLSYDHASSSLVYYKNDVMKTAFSDVINDPTADAYYSDNNRKIAFYNEMDARFIQFANACVARDFVP